MFSNAKDGDRVWSMRFGWGTIISVDEQERYPISVDFDSSTDENYTKDGKELHDDVSPSLFWGEVKFKTPEKPKQLIVKYVPIIQTYVDGELKLQFGAFGLNKKYALYGSYYEAMLHNGNTIDAIKVDVYE